MYFYGLERRAAAYGLLLVVTGTLVRDGGPGWFSLLVLAGFWNMIRFAVVIPVSVVRLLRARHQEKVMIRDWQRTQRAELPTAGTDGWRHPYLSLRRHERSHAALRLPSRHGLVRHRARRAGRPPHRVPADTHAAVDAVSPVARHGPPSTRVARSKMVMISLA